MADVVDRLSRRGFPEDFRIVGDRLQVVRTGERLETKDLVIREYHRFEGATGVRSTVVDAFGVYSDPALNALLRDVPIRPAARAA